MRSRIHLTVLTADGKTNLFNLIGQPLPHVAAAKVNPYVQPFDGICMTLGHEQDETFAELSWDERYERDASGKFQLPFRRPHVWVMRGHLQCSCCGPSCIFCGVGVPGTKIPRTGHGPGASYVEAVSDLTWLTPQARLAVQMQGNKDYANQLTSMIQSIGVDPAQLGSHLPYLVGQDGQGKGAVEDVLAGVSRYPSDIFFTSAALQMILHPEKGAIASVHRVMSKDFSQRPSNQPVTRSSVLIPSNS